MACRRRFTLVELLVVVAIIAILAAMLLPVLARAREQARRVTCINNNRNFALAFAMYSDEFDGAIVRPPENCTWWWAQNIGQWWGGASCGWDSYACGNPPERLLNSYLGGANSPLFVCPSDPDAGPGMAGLTEGRPRLYYGYWGNTYNYNFYLVKTSQVALGSGWDKPGMYLRMDQIRFPDRTVLIHEWSAYDVIANFDRNGWIANCNWRWSLHEQPGLPLGGKTRNVTLFPDSHVGFVRYEVGLTSGEEYLLLDGN